jgi:hypothetical protein
MTDHELPGIETDNLLGFLAILGLLRAVERAKPQWFPRAYFSGVPLAARLVVDSTVDRTQIAEAAAEGCAAYASLFEFQYSDLTFDQAAARKLLIADLAEGETGLVGSALCSDAAIKPDGKIEATPLCAMFGQGHQSFLDRLGSVSHGKVPRALQGKNAPDLNAPAFIERALFQRWLREDKTETFRWDYVEDRRYALRAVDPSTDPPTTEHGANRLAVLGLLSFQCAPRGTPSGRTRLSARGVSRGAPGSSVRITWPVWGRPTTLRGIEALLDIGELHKDEPDFVELAIHDISQARRVRRMSVGKFLSFSRAEPLVPQANAERAG